MKKDDIFSFFMVSNMIEGIDDGREDKACAELYSQIKHAPYEKAMFSFHSKMNYLNDYCTAGRLRDYGVSVGGKSCLDHKNIKTSLTLLFASEPKTLAEIIQWHTEFEKCHPFGDGNGRVGRFLMLMQSERNKVKLPEIFFTMENFEKNRQEYYKWFK
jgi:hypothetical protein